MSKVDQKRWRRTSPLAAIFYLGRIFEAIAKNAVQSLAPLVAYLVATEGPILFRITVGSALFFTVVVTVSVIRYWFFRYRITGDSVLIREGVLKKTQLDIKFERIQAINTQQNIIYRHFDLVTVKFDTAGSAKQEGNLPAIRSELAESLKERIRRDRPVTVNEDGEEETELPPRPILSLTNGDMVRIGLSSNRSLIFLVLLGPLLDQVDKRVDRVIQSGAVDFITNGTDITLATGLGLAAMAAIGFVLLLVLASITGAFLRYHKFSLVADEDVLRSTGGLLTRHEHSVNLAKIQTLEARQNPILRMFRRFRLRAKQASSGQPGKGKHFVIPLCTEQQLPDVEKEVFHDEFEHMEMQPGSSSFNSIHKRYIRSRILYTGVMPAVFLSSLFLALGGIGGLVLLLWIPIDAFFVWMLHRKYGFIVNEEGMVLRRGLFGYRVNAFLHRKVQRVSVTQTIAQQRRELATLRFYMASGSLKLPYIEYELAKQIRDFMLYRVESSRLAWH